MNVRKNFSFGKKVMWQFCFKIRRKTKLEASRFERRVTENVRLPVIAVI